MAKGGANAGVAGLGAQMAMGVGMANTAPAAAAAPAASVEDRLVKLKSLKDKGLISDDDFAKKRDAILAEI
jgi:membrane protease subunit (stomatin/prohibitin family)